MDQRCKIDPRLFTRDMKMLMFLGYDPYNSHDAVAKIQEDIRDFERLQEDSLTLKE